LGSFFAALVCLVLLFFLGTLVRFSILGSIRHKGSAKRLCEPKLAEIESKWGIKLPDSLEAGYKNEFVGRSDFYLAPPSTNQPGWWYIEGFLPLTRRDVTDWIAATKVPGIPIALNGSKGTYYLPFESLRQQLPPPVMLRLPGRKRTDVRVANTIEEFFQFESKDVPSEVE
jgi:hypothetical protein